MLTIEQLKNLNALPELSEISFQLYVDFYKQFLRNIMIRYHLQDGNQINIQFKDYSIPHMLGMQHYDFEHDNKDFYKLVQQDVINIEYYTQNSDKRIRNAFRAHQKRILAFACTYYILKNGKMVLFADGILQGKIQMDYAWFELISDKGITIGARKCIEDPLVQVPLTILIASKENPRKHIRNGNLVLIEATEIFAIQDNKMELTETIYH